MNIIAYIKLYYNKILYIFLLKFMRILYFEQTIKKYQYINYVNLYERYKANGSQTPQNKI